VESPKKNSIENPNYLRTCNGVLVYQNLHVSCYNNEVSRCIVAAQKYTD